MNCSFTFVTLYVLFQLLYARRYVFRLFFMSGLCPWINSIDICQNRGTLDFSMLFFYRLPMSNLAGICRKTKDATLPLHWVMLSIFIGPWVANFPFVFMCVLIWLFYSNCLVCLFPLYTRFPWIMFFTIRILVPFISLL